MIYLIKNLIKKFLSIFNIFAHKSISKDKIILFISLFKVKIPSNIKLIRIGSKNDGGYLVPDVLDKIDHCFSAGIGSNVEFEKSLLKYQIKSYGADNSINNIPEEVDGYSFLKKNIDILNDESNITFEKWVNDQNLNNNLIGQIDIEGGEYNLILNTPNKIFQKFKVLIFEFHNIQKISDNITYEFYSSSIKKLLENFNVCHIHINNAEKFTTIRNINVPHLLEVTFLRKDFYDKKFNKVQLPHLLDKKNVPNNPEIKFDKIWLENIT
tara:strand:- start:153 stop:956 length:804 start_codon:yes stop_codon:yes gene_type:complete